MTLLKKIYFRLLIFKEILLIIALILFILVLIHYLFYGFYVIIDYETISNTILEKIAIF